MRSRPVVALLAVAVLAALVPVAPAAPSAAPNPCAGTIESPANGTTVVSVQGAKGRQKRAARLVAVGPRGGIRWVHRSGKEMGIVWSYDVDPLANGNLFVTATRPEKTVFYELDPRTGDPVWTEVTGFVDTHDADLLDEHRILVANMRNYDRDAGRNRDRLLIYNRTSDAVEWEWLFRDHYPRTAGGNYTDDWTHVNDVDRIGEGRYLASPRNLDQVIVVDRSSGEIELRLGADGRTSVMHQQHNPQYLESDAGRPTILVADSENDRIVEYERRDGSWTRTWELGSSKSFSWPRDADRLPNGNTLVVDSRNHRVLEVTPEGEVVWEFYSPWLVYDAERVRLGDEPGGPTIRDLGATGAHALTDGVPRPADDLGPCAATIAAFDRPATGTATTSVGPGGEGARDGGGSGGSGPVSRDGGTTPGRPGVGPAAGLVAVALVAVAAAAIALARNSRD